MPDVVDASAQLRLQLLGRDEMLPSPSVMASDPAHDRNTFPVDSFGSAEEAPCSQLLLQPRIPSYTKAARARATRTQSS